MDSFDMTDAEHDALPTLEWLSQHEHQTLVDAALTRVASGAGTFADARLLAFEIGLARQWAGPG